MICYAINSNGLYVLKLKDTTEGACILVPGHTYRFEWHTWSAEEAEFEIKAEVLPKNDGFKPFHFKKIYPDAHSDMGGFYFTV